MRLFLLLRPTTYEPHSPSPGAACVRRVPAAGGGRGGGRGAYVVCAVDGDARPRATEHHHRRRRRDRWCCVLAAALRPHLARGGCAGTANLGRTHSMAPLIMAALYYDSTYCGSSYYGSTLLWLHFYYDVQSALLFASSRYEVDVVAWHAEMTADRRAVRTDLLPYPRLYPTLHPPPYPLLHLLYSRLYCALTTTLLTTTVPTRCAPRRGGALRPHAQ